MTSPATLPPTSSLFATPAACPSLATTTITPCCPPARTVTCTVTETWHSTNYESTKTLFSFLSVFTVTCTETVRYVPIHPTPRKIQCSIAQPHLSDPNILNRSKLTNQTFSIYSPSSSYLFSQNNSTSSSSHQSLIACPNGVLARKRDECPEASSAAFAASMNLKSPCSIIGALVPASGYSGNPIPSVVSLSSSRGCGNDGS